MMPLLLTQFCAHSAEGHGRYRVHGPGRALARLPGVTVVDCDPYHRHAEWLFDHADVLVLHGVNPELLPVVQRRRAAGKVTTFEACDYYPDVQGWNQHVAGWLDRTLIDQFWLLVRAVDAVQTSTQALAEAWKPAARRVAVFDNGIADVPPLTPPPPRPFTVGWAGSLTHLADWFRTAPVLEGWVKANPGTRLAVMTDPRAEGFVRLPAERYTFKPNGPWDEYRTFLGELDVGVVPLLPSPFNRGRTDLKYLEYAAHGVVGLFADSPPYCGSVEHGTTGLLFRTHAELLAGLDRLYAEKGLRYSIRTAAHAAAASRTEIAVTESRRKFYDNLFTTPPKNEPLPAELRAEAIRDGRYHVLKAGAPECMLANAHTEPSTPARAGEFEKVLVKYPRYWAALRMLSRTYNDVGRYPEALAAAERVLAARPDSPGAWVEAARARNALGDRPAAVYAADKALACNPGHPTAWALRLSLAGDAATANRMAACQPHSFMAALAAARFDDTAGRVKRLTAAVVNFSPDLLPEERPLAAAAFGQVLADGLDADDPPPGGVELYRRAAAAFPESARVADLLGRALRAAGEIDASAAAFARAGELARIGQTYEAEAEALDGRAYQWQLCEYLRRWEGP